jgi:hypothetical protein
VILFIGRFAGPRLVLPGVRCGPWFQSFGEFRHVRDDRGG